MENINFQDVKKRSLKSVLTLFTQSGYSAILGFLALTMLTITNGTNLLGIYGVVLSSLTFFNYITDLGLGAALMQKPEITEKDKNSVFWIQMSMGLIVFIFSFFWGEKFIASYSDAPNGTIYLFWSVILAFIMIIARTVPSVLLEKEHAIYKVVLIQSFESTLFYLTIIIGSFMGLGIWALIAAVLLRAIIGTFGMYRLHPFRPGFRVGFASIKYLLSFGLPFQLNSFIAVVKDDLLMIYLSKVMGLADFGLFTFGKKYGEFALRLINDNLNRVAFPIFARYQLDPLLLKKNIEKIFSFSLSLLIPALFASAVVLPQIISLNAGYQLKWMPALDVFFIFLISSFFVGIFSPVINLFNATGRVIWSVVMMIIFTILIWLAVPVLVKVYGLQGAASGFLIVNLLSSLLIFTTLKIAKISFSKIFSSAILAGLAFGLVIYTIKLLGNILALNVLVLIVFEVIIGGLVWVLIMMTLEKETITKSVKLLSDKINFGFLKIRNTSDKR